MTKVGCFMLQANILERLFWSGDDSDSSCNGRRRSANNYHRHPTFLYRRHHHRLRQYIDLSMFCVLCTVWGVTLQHYQLRHLLRQNLTKNDRRLIQGGPEKPHKLSCAIILQPWLMSHVRNHLVSRRKVRFWILWLNILCLEARVLVNITSITV